MDMYQKRKIRAEMKNNNQKEKKKLEIKVQKKLEGIK